MLLFSLKDTGMVRFQDFASSFCIYPSQIKSSWQQCNGSSKIIKFAIIFYMYNHQNAVSDFLHQPTEAFLFRPFHSNSDTIRDDFKIPGNKKIRRLIFQAWGENTYTQFELSQLQKLEEYIRENKVVLDKRWNKAWKMKYLLSTGCNREKCVNDMKKFTQGYMERVKELHFTRTASKLLSDGVFYIAGKDSHYRPIIVYNVEKIVRLNYPKEDLLEAQVYLLQFVIRNYLIPGQVENWVGLIDSGYQGLFSMVDAMREAFTFLADTYRSRLFACYNVRITTAISIIWGIVKKFLEDDTIEKINLFDQNVPEPLFQYCNPAQIQERFGGTMPNIPEGQFWPPREWSTDYKCAKSPVQYMTRQQYTEYYNNGTLKDTKIHEENLILPTSTQLRENRIEKEFRSHVESCSEDQLIFEKDIEPYSKISAPLSYNTLKAAELKKMTMK